MSTNASPDAQKSANAEPTANATPVQNGSPASPSGAPSTPVASSSSSSAPADGAGRRGRPPGSTDKRPRKRRSGGSGAHSTSGAAPRPAPAKRAPKNPLEGAVPHDAKPGAAVFSEPTTERGKVGPPNKTASKAAELLALDSTELAAMACRLGSAILVKAGQKRYGEDAIMLALDDKETEEVTRIGSRVLDKYLPKLEPEWALAITLGIIYTSKVLTLEGARDHGVPVATMKAALEQHQAAEVSKAQQVAANIAAAAKAADGNGAQA